MSKHDQGRSTDDKMFAGEEKGKKVDLFFSSLDPRRSAGSPGEAVPCMPERWRVSLCRRKTTRRLTMTLCEWHTYTRDDSREGRRKAVASLACCRLRVRRLASSPGMPHRMVPYDDGAGRDGRLGGVGARKKGRRGENWRLGSRCWRYCLGTAARDGKTLFVRHP